MLSGDENLTLRTLAGLASCLGSRFELDLVGLYVDGAVAGDAAPVAPSRSSG